ncbi:MAG: DUF4286 family protein [Gammaproteobacteria bacterium]
MHKEPALSYIYEVNLTIQESSYNRHEDWLIEHFHDMVSLNGFDGLRLFSNKNVNPLDDNHMRYRNLVVQYYVSDYKILETYLKKQAIKMRSQVFEKLGDGYTVTRRVLEAIEIFNKEHQS